MPSHIHLKDYLFILHVHQYAIGSYYWVFQAWHHGVCFYCDVTQSLTPFPHQHSSWWIYNTMPF